MTGDGAGAPLRVSVDTGRCVASGMCAFVAPEVFDQRPEDGVVVIRRRDPPADQAEAVHEAAVRCPAQVIDVE
ncbi:ferredoxin [Streptomyces sp. MAR4 CNX-425]|uniref:ferredoxin n=1 Tax=Streptomyces sp. MAR4 CNX-425 TaxID=3406343 RepID=UPI003B50C1E4